MEEVNTPVVVVEKCVCCEETNKPRRKRGWTGREDKSAKRKKAVIDEQRSTEDSDDSRTSTYVCPASPLYMRQLDWLDDVLITHISTSTQTEGDLFFVL